MKKFALIFALFTLVSIVVTAQPQLEWRFANAEVINAGTQLQFDVEVKADATGSFHRDLQVYFDYNTAAFGSNLVAGGNISVSNLTLMNNHYSVVNTADNTSSKFAVITEATNEMTQSGNATYFNELPTTFTGLLRVTIDIVDNLQTAGIAFDQALMDGGQYYQSTSNTDPMKYADPSAYNNDLLATDLTTLYGNITYASAGAYALPNCTVSVFDGAILMGSAVTDANGFYNVAGVADGSYTLETSCSEPYSYTTDVGDINVVINHILGSPLTGLNFLAGNVTGDAFIDVADVNQMINNILGLATGYAIADWVFEDQSVNVVSGIATQDYEGLQAGDADGSW